MITQKDIVGVVILYNSSMEVFCNIDTYIDQIEKLYVVDNSIYPNEELVERLKSYSKIVYKSLDGNKGIATALNWSAREAIKDNFKLLLTMDDDTATPNSMISDMIKFWNSYSEPLGILSGVHHHKQDNLDYRPLLYTLTSGNLLNLSAYESIGRFCDDFFIDHVDHDFCIRLNNAGYQVIELPKIHLNHKLGYSEKVKVGPWIIRTYGTNAPIRLYYYTRNGIYVARKYFNQYPSFSWMFTKELTRRWLKTLFLDKDRITRVKMMLKGTKDGFRSHLGEYEP